MSVPSGQAGRWPAQLLASKALAGVSISGPHHARAARRRGPTSSRTRSSAAGCPGGSPSPRPISDDARLIHLLLQLLRLRLLHCAEFLHRMSHDILTAQCTPKANSTALPAESRWCFGCSVTCTSSNGSMIGTPCQKRRTGSAIPIGLRVQVILTADLAGDFRRQAAHSLPLRHATSADRFCDIPRDAAMWLRQPGAGSWNTAGSCPRFPICTGYRKSRAVVRFPLTRYIYLHSSPGWVRRSRPMAANPPPASRRHDLPRR